ncbi:hypothetical protein AB3Y40_16900 [Yoonia sp. R2331]|uniref:hypothetical protein n=1 Tax=Yoonia sp. R2331 TaxID=3237238 RepID=UPI0034E464CF
MNATSALVLIMILAFSADRLTKAIMFVLAFVPRWQRYFRDPEIISNRVEKYKMRNRYLIAYTVIVGVIACSAVFWFDDLRILTRLSGNNVDASIDIVVTTLVVMGGSDLVSRLVQISGIGEMGAAAASGDRSERNKPVEIVGRLVLENDGAYIGPPSPSSDTKPV